MTESQTTQPLISSNVLLIGDRCIDEYKIGTVDRLSPEAPVPVMKIIETFSRPGMAANVDINLRNLGIKTDFVTNDETITKTRFIDKRSGQHLLRVDSEHTLTKWNRCTPLPLNKYDLIVISDYNKGFLLYEDIEYIIKQFSGPIFIDTKKTQLADISASNVFVKINEVEYKNTRSLPSNLIVTLGDQGAWYKNTTTETRIPTKQVEVVDVCGAGDTFLAALARQYIFTRDLVGSIIFANAAAGITVQHRGNYAPSYSEVEKDINA